jgi:hypothetical protein
LGDRSAQAGLHDGVEQSVVLIDFALNECHMGSEFVRKAKKATQGLAATSDNLTTESSSTVEERLRNRAVVKPRNCSLFHVQANVEVEKTLQDSENTLDVGDCEEIICESTSSDSRQISAGSLELGVNTEA